MKKHITKHVIGLCVIALALLLALGCSNMMENLGSIRLHIVLDTPDIEVASYSLEALHSDISSPVSFGKITPPTHSLSSLKKGIWTLTVTAFDDEENQLGKGTQRVVLKEGQILESTLLVVFTQAEPEVVFTFSSPSRFDSADGQLIGTTEAMEYRLASDSDDTPYTACSEGTTILGSGEYLVRYAAAHGLSASEPLTVTVPPYQPIQLTITEPTLTTDKVYDGTDEISGPVSAGDLIGITGDDEVTVTAAASYDSKVAGSGKTITIIYTLDGDDAGNYLKPANKTVAGLISKIPLTIIGTTITTEKTYDGSTSAEVTLQGTMSGDVTGDDVSVTATATYDDKTAASDKTITITYTLDGADAENYLKPASKTEMGLINKRSLTVSGTTVTTEKAYDGSTSAAVNFHGTISGVVTGDDVSVTATATYDTKDVGEGKPITITYTLTGDDSDNYITPDDSTATETGAIGHRQLAAIDLDLTTDKEYDGTNSVAAPAFTLEGKVTGEDVTVTAEAIYDAADAADDREITITYTLNGSDAGNYLKPANKTVAGLIRKKQLTITEPTLTTDKVYDGTDEISGPVSAGDLIGITGDDEVTVTAAASYDSKVAGSGKTITIIYTLDGDDAENYLKPANKTVAGLIRKKQLTMEGTTVDTTKEYDGLVAATITSEGTLIGVISGDAVTVEALATYDDKSAGSGKTITIIYTLDGSDAGNYLKPANKTVAGLISKIPLTVSGTTVTPEKKYDGLNAAKVELHGFLSGVVSSDTLSVQARATYDTKNAGTEKVITVSYTLLGEEKDSYITPEDSIISRAGVITPKLLFISIGSDYVLSKEYDGTTSAATPVLYLDGVIGNDDVTVSGEANYDSAAVGIEKEIGLVYSLSGTDKDNYIKPVDQIFTRWASITKKQLTISGPTLESNTKTYDGTTAVLGTVTPGSLSGVLEEEDVTVEATAQYGSADVRYSSGGLFNQITVKYTLDGTNAGNYVQPNWDLRWGAIIPKPLTVIDTLFPASKVYDKTKVITITSPGTLSGVIEGDDLSLISVSASYYDSYNVGNDKTVFIRYEIEGADKYNYNLGSDTSRTASITPALLTATVGDYRQIYGENPPAFEVEVTGFVGNDSILNIIRPTASAGTDSSSAVGTYTIEITGGSAINDNYIFDVRDTGTLTIEKVAGPAAPSEQIVGQFPSEATLIELTGFALSASGLEAAVAIDGTNYAAYADVSVDESGGATIAGLSGVTTATKVRIRVKETATSLVGSYKEISVTEKVFVVGSIGPGGGYVFYDDEAGYDFDSSGTIEEDEKNLLPDARYLEAAPYGWYDGDTDSQGEYSGDDDPRFQWGAYGYAVDPPATATAIGSGATNTANIVDFHDNLSDYYTNRTAYDKYNDGTVAAKVCAEYSLEKGGVTYDNWFLPSKDELNLMYRNLKDQGLGSFTVYNHWSSSEYDENKAWYQFFENGNQDGYVRNYSLRVRPVRAF